MKRFWERQKVVWRNQRGDTLVEVTIALGILSFIMVGAFATADLAYKLGQTAKERSIMVNAAQEQADALKSFRDSHTWDQFVNGNGPLPGCDSAPTTYCGVTSRHTADCDSTLPGQQECFHMVLRNLTENGQSVTEWVPVAGPVTLAAANAQLGVWAGSPDPGFGAIGHYYDFRVSYGNTKLGMTDGPGPGDSSSGELRLKLADLDLLR